MYSLYDLLTDPFFFQTLSTNTDDVCMLGNGVQSVTSTLDNETVDLVLFLFYIILCLLACFRMSCPNDSAFLSSHKADCGPEAHDCVCVIAFNDYLEINKWSDGYVMDNSFAKGYKENTLPVIHLFSSRGWD